jgi:hypothetical protein
MRQTLIFLLALVITSCQQQNQEEVCPEVIWQTTSYKATFCPPGNIITTTIYSVPEHTDMCTARKRAKETDELNKQVLNRQKSLIQVLKDNNHPDYAKEKAYYEWLIKHPITHNLNLTFVLHGR